MTNFVVGSLSSRIFRRLARRFRHGFVQTQPPTRQQKNTNLKHTPQ